jgi:hypothetical protein
MNEQRFSPVAADIADVRCVPRPPQKRPFIHELQTDRSFTNFSSW